ncbi:MAG: c-type cytochrome [Polaromonas sp.]
MRQQSIKTSLAAATLSVLFSAALAQTPTEVQRVPRDFGKSEFQSSCASCHGTSGKGNGPLVPLLRRNPPDLTLLAKNNQGVFPMNRLYEVIDGENVPAHGSRDMPVWGRAYRTMDAAYYFDTEYDANGLVRARILSLLEYINRIQVR